MRLWKHKAQIVKNFTLNQRVIHSTDFLQTMIAFVRLLFTYIKWAY